MSTRGWYVVLVLLAVGCAGELRDPGRFAFLLDDDDDGGAPEKDSGAPRADAAVDAGAVKPLVPPPKCVTDFFKRCATAACHGAGAPQVDLTSAGVEKRVVGKPSGAAGLCKGRTLVATDGSASLLLDKIKASPPCGDRMPLFTNAADDAEVSCLSDWIDSLSSDN